MKDLARQIFRVRVSDDLLELKIETTTNCTVRRTFDNASELRDYLVELKRAALSQSYSFRARPMQDLEIGQEIPKSILGLNETLERGRK